MPGLKVAKVTGVPLRVVIDQRARNCSSYRILRRRSALSVATGLRIATTPLSPHRIFALDFTLQHVYNRRGACVWGSGIAHR